MAPNRIGGIGSYFILSGLESKCDCIIGGLGWPPAITGSGLNSGSATRTASRFTITACSAQASNFRSANGVRSQS